MRLDRYGPWREYSSSTLDDDVGHGDGDGDGDARGKLAMKVAGYRPTDVIAVDWHGMLAWEDISRRCCRASSAIPPRHSVRRGGVSPSDLPPPAVANGDSLSSSSSSSSSSTFSSWHPRRDVHVVYFNCRVYSSSAWGDVPSSPSSTHDDDKCADDVSFYKGKERLSCRMAAVIVCVSENDRSALRRLMREDVGDDDDDDEWKRDPNDNRDRREKDVHVLYPPLRGDIRELAMTYDERDDERNDDENDHADDDVSGQRYKAALGRGSLDRFLSPEARHAIEDLGGPSMSSSSSSMMDETTIRRHRSHFRVFVTCVVRLSPEKSPHNFVALLRMLGGVDFLRRHCLVPLMCGSRSVGDYADDVVGELRRMMIMDDDGGTSWPCVVLDRHIGPTELAAIFARTAINVHVSVCAIRGHSRIHLVVRRRMQSPRALTPISRSILFPNSSRRFDGECNRLVR